MAARAAQPAAAPQPSDLEIVELNHLIIKQECYCLNEQPGHGWQNLFMGDDRLQLRSDADEQLLLHIGFQETVRLHSISLSAPQNDSAPLTVKLYVNRNSMGFSDTDDLEPTQTLELTPEDLKPDSITLLKYVKFQRVSLISIFIEDNNGAEQTCLSGLKFFGTPVAGTKMNELKKQGEEG